VFEIVALTDEAGYLRCEVGLCCFLLPFGMCFLSASWMILLNWATVWSMFVIGRRFRCSNFTCLVFEFLPVSTFEVVCFAWLCVVCFGLCFDDDG
jgi:hypothetical protein